MNWRSKTLRESARNEACVSCGADDGITQRRLMELLSYDHISGEFTWVSRPANCIQIGDIAGTIDKKSGYARVVIGRRVYSQHRLAFMYMLGYIPPYVDHKNGIRSDNSWSNLRESTAFGNNANKKAKSGSSSGLKGVTYQKSRNNWRAKIMVRGKFYHLGEFDNPIDAHEAYCNASKRMNGEFHCDGSR
jgi:hypothetical protein